MEKVASTCICYQVLLSSTESLVCHSVMTRRDGMGVGGRRLKWEEIHVYLRQIHDVVWQRPT